VVYEAWDQVKRVEVVQEKCLAALNAFDEHVDAYGVLEGEDDEGGDGVMVIVQGEGAELVVAGVAEAVIVVIVVVAVVAVAAAAVAAVVGKMMGEVLW
jgi:hypothetical protein